jgi:hypothetical protein
LHSIGSFSRVCLIQIHGSMIGLLNRSILDYRIHH